MFCLGFGFDQKKTNDFKVVRITYVRGAGGVYLGPPEVEVYSLSNGLWKTVNSKGINSKLNINYSTISLNGAIHWVFHSRNEDRECTNSLLVFNLSDETFSERGLPQRLGHVSPLDLSISSCGDRISFIWNENGSGQGESCDRCTVWVMNQYGKTEPLMEKFVVDLKDGIANAIGFRRNGEFLMVQYPGDLLSYHPESMEFKDLDIHGRCDSFFLSKYVESLVFLEGSSGATVDPSASDESDSEEPTELQPEWVTFSSEAVLECWDTLADLFGIRG